MRMLRFLRKWGPTPFLALSVCVLTTSSSVGRAQSYGTASSPARSTNLPLSSYRSGLISRPNPLDNSTNRVVTGNVGAGKHFRGPVPYQSTTSLSAPLGSTSLDSFMRYTSPPATPRTSVGTYSPFQSPTGTATGTVPGTRSVSRPTPLRFGAGTTPKPGSGTRGELYWNLPSSSPSWQPESGANVSAEPRLKLWPGSTPDPSPIDVPQRFGEPPAQDHSPRPGTEAVTGRDYQQEMEALQQRLGQVQNELSALEQSLATREPQSLRPPVAEKGSGPFSGAWPERDVATSTKGVSEPLGSQSRKDELLQEAARLLSGQSEWPAPSGFQDNAALPENRLSSDIQTRLRLYRPDTPLPQTQGLPKQSSFGSGVTSPIAPQGVPKPRPAAPPIPAAVESDVVAPQSEAAGPAPAELEVIQPSVQGPVWKLDTKKTTSSLKTFDRHLKTAQQYARQGKYAEAADAFTLASAYRPSDPAAYLGKSHALLAAGEYLPSALALAKAVELDPGYTLKKTDLIGIAGGPDAFIARFNALDEAIRTGTTGHLYFLIAYIYHQMDRPQEAKVAIEAARMSLPASQAVSSLRAAIESIAQ